MKLIAVTIVVASVALPAAACGGGPTDASDTRTAPTIPQPKPSWTTIGGIRLHTLRSAVVRTRGRGVKHGSAYDYRVGGSAVAVFFEHGRVASLRTWDPIVALPDGVPRGERSPAGSPPTSPPAPSNAPISAMAVPPLRLLIGALTRDSSLANAQTAAETARPRGGGASSGPRCHRRPCLGRTPSWNPRTSPPRKCHGRPRERPRDGRRSPKPTTGPAARPIRRAVQAESHRPDPVSVVRESRRRRSTRPRRAAGPPSPPAGVGSVAWSEPWEPLFWAPPSWRCPSARPMPPARTKG